MDLAAAVLAWTLAVCVLLATLMFISYMSAVTDLVRAKIQSEKRMH